MTLPPYEGQGPFSQEAKSPTERTDGVAGHGLQRVTELTSPPVVGRFYLVPTVTYPWLMDAPSFTKAWPVLGGKHEDAEHLGFGDEHYHVDSRFVSTRDYRRALDRNYRGVATFEGTPLSMRGHDKNGVWGIKAHPPVVWQRRKCMRELHRPTRIRELGVRIDAVYAGKRCKHGKGGFICPHRGFALGTVPVVGGVITCPLHGLRIDAETGAVLPSPVTGDLNPATTGISATSAEMNKA